VKSRFQKMTDDLPVVVEKKKASKRNLNFEDSDEGTKKGMEESYEFVPP
jgi:hypothetical protein